MAASPKRRLVTGNPLSGSPSPWVKGQRLASTHSSTARLQTPSSRTGTWQVGKVEADISAECGFQVADKVNSFRLSPLLLIALHSPNALVETGLRMCPPEKSQDNAPFRLRAVRSLQSGLSASKGEIRAFSVYFQRKMSRLSLQSRLHGGARSRERTSLC